MTTIAVENEPPAPRRAALGDQADAVDETPHRAHAIDEALRRLVAEKPLLALAAALTGGFIAGRILQRL